MECELLDFLDTEHVSGIVGKIVNVNQNIFIDPFMIIAYNIDEQDYLLDLSALLL